MIPSLPGQQPNQRPEADWGHWVGPCQFLREVLRLQGWIGFTVLYLGLPPLSSSDSPVTWGHWAGPNQTLRDLCKGPRLTRDAEQGPIWFLARCQSCKAGWDSLHTPSAHATELKGFQATQCHWAGPNQALRDLCDWGCWVGP